MVNYLQANVKKQHEQNKAHKELELVNYGDLLQSFDLGIKIDCTHFH